ncbi:hypothetical protein SAMN04244553_3625 [Nocardia amikacinitolerans]|uniref:DUF4760 domain-containing protein n=1 Tax=Nocardia amikacinitolerans TaxID=756689 RepID=A0A285LK03_9NOCA|nr:hypothetical protein [Nocardia amikacinitolerans]MCP2278424.1 hypothetical protein [Nocardia amikacinitolerans]SNY84377.1 hypothetical protein SAMN04244553_3625 [Nocardia amikacinitolerans]
MTTVVISSCVAVLVAILAFGLNQRGLILQERRHFRLTRVSSQLAELYAPLRALVEVNEEVWELLRRSHLPPRSARTFTVSSPEWRWWRDHMLMPTNRAMRDLIIEHADLLEPEMPEALRAFCAHVASMEVVLAAEADGVKRPTLVRHPGDAYVRHVRETFASLEAERQRMLNTRRGGRSVR